MRRIALAGAAVAAGLAVAASAAGCSPGRERSAGASGDPATSPAAEVARPGSKPVAASPPVRVSAGPLDQSVAGAYAFLGQMMDRSAVGAVPRLVQSYTGGVLGQQGFTASETYDDAVMIDAYLAAGTRAGRARAELIGDGLLYVQAHDPIHDGRIRAAYAPSPLRKPADVHATNPATLTGDMAWAGQALAQLYAATGRAAYLDGAEAIGNWVQANCYDTRGAGGYTGGYTADGQKLEWKSTEHNIDVYVLFSLLARETGDPVWSARAAWARRFVMAMWDTSQRAFDVGTASNGVLRNEAGRPEDVNSWSFLAFRDPAYAASVTWDVKNLAVTAGGFSGVSFCSGDRSGVWFEGTAHLADALEFRAAAGDGALAAGYLADLYYAQAHGPDADGLGIMAVSRNGLSDCDGGTYYASLHTGTTAWYILAAKKVNPFVPIAPGRTGVSRRP
jgi:hypothetical protein